MIKTIPDIAADINEQGFCFVPAEQTRRLLAAPALALWQDFAQSWNGMPEDQYMADGGRYRFRRHAALRVSEGGIEQKPPQAHFQTLDNNHLNGGRQRWFEPVPKEVAVGPTNLALLGLCQTIFNPVAEHHVEMHQFRIKPDEGSAGKPTPEGMHRDGVDWVCVALVNRVNVEQGVTDIFSSETKKSLGSFTLTDPLDAVFLDDRRVMHDVTPINLINKAKEGYRDALVLTFTGQF